MRTSKHERTTAEDFAVRYRLPWETFLQTARAWLRHGRRLEPDLREILGSQEFEELQTDREVSVAAIEAGLLRRSLFVATRPR